jgi:murein lipoprotein
MLIKKIALAAIVITATGCANTDALEASIASLNNKVDALTNKVDTLSGEVADLKGQQQDNSAAIEEVKTSAASTNERMDNMVATYKK